MNFKDSSLFFHNFLERNDILLDFNYEKILNIYNNDDLDECEEYTLYFNIFNQYLDLKEKIYIFYYILILFLIDEAYLQNFCRYIISIFSRLQYVNTDIQFYLIKKMNKPELLQLLNQILNDNNTSEKSLVPYENKENMLFGDYLKMSKFFIFITCFQNYF